jgi:hypothetical protein
VFVAINPHRKVDTHGHLTSNCSLDKGCEFYTLKRWKGHPGWWIITDSANFPGFWTDTPGTYYWQAHHTAPPNGLCNTKDDCEISSPIHSFHVHG